MGVVDIKNSCCNGAQLFCIVVICLASTGCVVAPSQPQQNRYTNLPQPKYTQPLPPSTLAVQPTLPPNTRVTADPLPNDYEYITHFTDSEGKVTYYYMHRIVESRSLKSNPNSKIAVADLWTLLPSGRGVFYKQGFNCTEAGSSFLIAASPNANDGPSLTSPMIAPQGTISFSQWSTACTKAGMFNQKPIIKNALPKKMT